MRNSKKRFLPFLAILIASLLLSATYVYAKGPQLVCSNKGAGLCLAEKAQKVNALAFNVGRHDHPTPLINLTLSGSGSECNSNDVVTVNPPCPWRTAVGLDRKYRGDKIDLLENSKAPQWCIGVRVIGIHGHPVVKNCPDVGNTTGTLWV